VTPRVCVSRLERWLEAEGARLEHLRYARPAASGDVEAWRLVPREPRARVVAAHGAGNDALYPQIALFQALVARGVEVFAFDVDGHGAASTTVFSADAIHTCVAAAVEQAERGRIELPLHLLGHSFGGSLVLHALGTGAVPHALSCIAISAPIDVNLTPRVAFAELLGFFRPWTLGQRQLYGAWGTVPAVGPLKRRAFPVRGATRTDAPFAYVAAIREVLARLDLSTIAGSIGVPVLLAYGTADRLVPIQQGIRLMETIPSAELFRVDGATHWSTVFAPAVVQRVAGWMDAHAAAGA
jgi:alpha-beta hydrolase superfamily lysophospholipase